MLILNLDLVVLLCCSYEFLIDMNAVLLFLPKSCRKVMTCLYKYFGRNECCTAPVSVLLFIRVEFKGKVQASMWAYLRYFDHIHNPAN